VERVSGDGFYSYRREVGEKKESRKAGRAGRKRSFRSELSEAGKLPGGERTPEDVEAEAAELIDAVLSAGDRLKQRTDREALAEYKDAVRDFLSAVVSRGLGIEEHTSGAHITRRKRYALVQVIDRKLEQLAAGLIANQQNQLDVLARIDEINGLIVDLTR
jgi:uncharacterized protein YaaR (DUF327 family)